MFDMLQLLKKGLSITSMIQVKDLGSKCFENI